MADRITELRPERGRLAIGPDGEQLPIPHELAHRINHELLDVVTLLKAAMDQAANPHSRDDDNMTSATSRCGSLARMADDKVRDVLRAMEPYV
jgi:hypothetical protein